MKEELSAYGLSEKEIEVYLSLLKISEATSNRISEISKINRTTVYDILETLKKKNIAYSFQKEKKLYFGAVRPEKLIDLMNEKANLIKQILPELNAIQETLVEKPKIEMFEGKIGLINASVEMLKHKEILVYGGSGKLDKVFDTFAANFAKKRVDKKVFLKAVIEEDVPEHMVQKDVAKYTEIKTLNSFKKINANFFIYGNNVLNLLFGEEILAINIKSTLFANAQRKIFEELWKIAKKI